MSLTVKGGLDTYSDYRRQVFAVSSNGDSLGGIGEVAFNNINSKEFYSDFIASGLLPFGTEDWLKLITQLVLI